MHFVALFLLKILGSACLADSAFVDPEVTRQCGTNIEDAAIRVLVQPGVNLEEKVMVLKTDAFHHYNSGIELSFPFSEKLAKFLKGKNRVVRGIFSAKDLSALKNSTKVELTLCLLEGKPVEYWFGKARH